MDLKTDFESRFKNFDKETINQYLPIYEKSYLAYYNVKYGKSVQDNEAILFLIAHLITVSKNAEINQGANLLVSSQSVDGVSVSYATPQSSDGNDFYYSTIYGQTFLKLTQSRLGVFFVK